jgi:hypothetical protein
LWSLIGGLGDNINLCQRCLEASVQHADTSGSFLVGELNGGLDLFGSFLLLGFLQRGHSFFM